MSFPSTQKIGLKKSSSERETKAFGFSLGQTLSSSTIVALYGDLGAGKTTFIKGLAAGYAHLPEDEVQSPTFTLFHIYNGEKKLYHFDLYRLKSEDEFIQRGLEDELYKDHLVVIEWAEKIESLLPPHTKRIRITDSGPHNRTIEVLT